MAETDQGPDADVLGGPMPSDCAPEVADAQTAAGKLSLPGGTVNGVDVQARARIGEFLMPWLPFSTSTSQGPVAQAKLELVEPWMLPLARVSRRNCVRPREAR